MFVFVRRNLIDAITYLGHFDTVIQFYCIHILVMIDYFLLQNYTFSFRNLLYKFLFLLLFLRIEVILYSKTEKM